MQTSHLKTCDGSIRCIHCGWEREISASTLANPIHLLEVKEGLAAKHVCKVRLARNNIRVWRSPTGRSLDGYYSGAMRRLMPA